MAEQSQNAQSFQCPFSGPPSRPVRDQRLDSLGNSVPDNPLANLEMPGLVRDGRLAVFPLYFQREAGPENCHSPASSCPRTGGNLTILAQVSVHSQERRFHVRLRRPRMPAARPEVDQNAERVAIAAAGICRTLVVLGLDRSPPKG